MSYSLEISARANNDIKALDNVTKKRIIKKLKFFLAQDNPLLLAKKLVNHKDGEYH